MKRLFLLPIILLLAGCATQSVPTGGPKDTKPPRVISTKPDSASINFHKNTLDFEFNEYVVLKNPQEQVIISPPLNKKPDIKLKGKHVIIQIKDTLRKDATYTINFGNSIADLTEGNVLNNYRFAFSTGSYIDSLMIRGKIENAFTGMPEKDICVMLYSSLDDSVPIKKRPLYLSKTNADGAFSMFNLAAGNYKLFALKDANSDYMFNQPSEAIAFLEHPIRITPEQLDSNISLKLFTEDRSKQRVERVRASSYGRLVMKFTKPVSPAFTVKAYKTAKLHEADTLTSIWQAKEHNKTKDSLTWWLTNDAMDSLHLIVSDTNIKDTVHLALIQRKEQRKRNGKTFYPLTNLDTHTQEANLPYDIEFNTPIKDFKKEAFTLKEDSTVIKDLEITQDSLTPRIFHLKYAWKEGSTYKIKALKGAFTSIFEESSDTLKTYFKPRGVDEYGSLSISIDFKDKSHQYLLQLTNETDVVLQEDVVKDGINKTYSFLKPQKYKLRIIFDTDNNGKWNTGNYLQHQQPEKMLYYKSPITIKAKWEDVEKEWKVE